MIEPAVVHDTFVLERAYPAPVARVFAFLSDPEKKRRWYASQDREAIEVFELDFREGGVERVAFRMGRETPLPGALLANDGRFEDIVANARVVLVTSMTLAGRRISTSLITFELSETDVGTDLTLTHQAVYYEGSGGPDMRKDGWRVLLDRLAAAMAETEPA